MISLGSGCTDGPCPPSEDHPTMRDKTADRPLFVTDAYPYDAGPLAIREIRVARCERGAPVELLVFAPVPPGDYAVIVFEHGFLVRNAAYTDVLARVARHGFVVVAPLMVEPGIAPLLGSPSAAEEADGVLALLDWLPHHLSDIAGVTARTDALGIAGHSRGGKVVWLVMLSDPTAASAVAALDPVDGSAFANEPRVTDAPFPPDVPTLVIGIAPSGACAPEGDNHEQYFAAAGSPAWHLIALDAGHVDLLDEGSPDFAFTSISCSAGEDRDAVRGFVAGSMVAFFRTTLLDDATASAYLETPSLMPFPARLEQK